MRNFSKSPLKKSLLAVAIAAALSAPLKAEQIFNIESANHPFFQFHFYDEGEQGYIGTMQEDYGEALEEINDAVSSSDFTATEITGCLTAAQLWTEILAEGSVATSPIEFTILKTEIPNAMAVSLPNKRPDGTISEYTSVADKILHDTPMRIPGIMLIGPLDFYVSEHLFTLPTGDGIDLVSTVTHEIAHALGISTDTDEEGYNSVFSSHLYDRFNTQFNTDLNFVLVDDDTTTNPVYESDKFYVGQSTMAQVFFKGANVSEVLAGSEYEGVPVNGYEYYYYADDGETLLPEMELSHLEFEHSMMSHQTYRNYTFFMEAELAVLQDIGYTIDRRNYFGYSIYGDNLVITNEHPFFARNASGSEYLTGIPNTATLGTGLHVYGKHNNITQVGTLLACGTAGVGIRVDGTANKLFIPESTLIRADGDFGTGILFAYGQDHELNIKGTVSAMGNEGVALRFDFGHNMLSDDPSEDGEYRGSYIWSNFYDKTLYDNEGKINNFDSGTGFELNLHGPLMQQVTIGGSVQGQKAAVFISDNALVGELNFITGAAVTGDIISLWDPDNPLIDAYVKKHPKEFDLYTSLNFGITPESETARNTGFIGDDDFAMPLAGSIQGYKSFKTYLYGGALTVNGFIEAYSLENSGDLTVLGRNNESYSINLKENFTLSEDSSLTLPFNTRESSLKIKAENLYLGGKLYLTALPDFYRNNESVMVKLKFEGNTKGNFTDAELGDIYSPVLNFNLKSPADLHNGSFEITASRAENAYAQYANDQGSRSTGNALYWLSASSGAEYEDLFTALDFSNPGIIANTLYTLSPQAYNMALFSSLKDKLLLERKVFDLQLSRNDFRESGSHVYASVVGSRLKTDRDEFKLTSDSSGVIAGVDFKQNRALTLGYDFILSSLESSIKGVHNANYEETSALCGIKLFYRPDNEGFYLSSVLHAGMLHGKMKRHLNIASYHSKVDSSWNSFIGTAHLGAGYNVNFKFSANNIELGPFALLQYAFQQRPDVNESGNAALDLEHHYYDSMPLTAGIAARTQTLDESGTKINLSFKSGFYHELLNNTDTSRATFKGSDYTFYSYTKRPDNKGLIADIAVSAELDNGWSAAFNVSAQGFIDDAHSVSAGFDLAYRF